MLKKKNYNVIGIMTGTSMDGLDLSFLRTDGKNFVRIFNGKSYNYSKSYKKKLKELVSKNSKKKIKRTN